MNYRFLDEARAELLEAGQFYVSKDRRLIDDLEREIDRAIAHLVEFPKAAKPVDRRHRSCKLRRFPFTLVYRVEADGIVIVAVAHAKRKQGYWRGR